MCSTRRLHGHSSLVLFQVRCGHIAGRFSYPGIMEAAYGKWGYYILSFLQFMYPFLGELPNVIKSENGKKILFGF